MVELCPDETRDALVDFRVGVGLPISGRVDGTSKRLTLGSFIGVDINELVSLKVDPGHGLGGSVAVSRKPQVANNYHQTGTISHHCDEPILKERIRSAVAVPIIVRNEMK